ncbi:Uncharacterized protein BM_BM8280 [Brugia malayi]|nr:Uncharacterized protein BM_BM8280 [Brugia malayi]CDQ03291.1 Bm8280, isoform b [Brugia malayi]VIP00061.1 Uncharacterized protein BM_BM8280 [Brugia malayi]
MKLIRSWPQQAKKRMSPNCLLLHILLLFLL